MSSQDSDIRAIDAAIKGKWEEAIVLNLKILESSPNNVAALNRLAKAYLEAGEIAKSIKVLKKVLRVDKYNTIAKKNFQRISEVHAKCKKLNGRNTHAINSSCLFLEEPGKTKVVRLLNLAPKSNLLSVNTLDEVLLTPKRHTIQVVSIENKYIGALPDDISKRLTTLIKGGNKYEAFIKSAEKKAIDIFIRETHKSQKFKNQPSFLTRLKDLKEAESRLEQYEDKEEKPEEEETDY